MNKPTVAVLSAGFGALLTLCVTATALTFPPPSRPHPQPEGILTVENIFRGDAYLCHWVPGEPEGKPDILITQPE